MEESVFIVYIQCQMVGQYVTVYLIIILASSHVIFDMWTPHEENGPYTCMLVQVGDWNTCTM